MEKTISDIDKMAIRLKVLDNKIKHLKSITDEVLNEVESAYQERIKELNLKKDTAQQSLSKLQETRDEG